MAGLFILKHMHNLSDEALCERWEENPYFQHFCWEVVLRHELPFDRSSLTRWRQRLGEEQIAALLQENPSVAHRTGAIETKDLERVVVDTTVQEKAVAHPTDARLTHRAIEMLIALVKREGVELRQSYRRVAKRAAIMVGYNSQPTALSRSSNATPDSLVSARTAISLAKPAGTGRKGLLNIISSAGIILPIRRGSAAIDCRSCPLLTAPSIPITVILGNPRFE